jgi:glycosyltransferase involved in cell wall biosynthesis
MTAEEILHTGNPLQQGNISKQIQIDRPLKGKLRIMPISDSPWAPTGFGTNTRNIGAILYGDGHRIGYGGCQNSSHVKWSTPWPLSQTETWAHFENLPILFPGQERFGEKSFPEWVRQYRPDVILAHLDFQMFRHITDSKMPTAVNFPLINQKTGKLLNRKERTELMNKAYKEVNTIKQKGPKIAAIIPFDGEPSIPMWQQQIDNIDFPVAMSRYGQQGLKQDFNCDAKYIPHGVDTDLFKPMLAPKYGKENCPNAFIVGCVARNQHRKNIPRLLKGFGQFVKKRKLSPDQAKLILHMDWNDAMGWVFPDFAKQYGLEEYLMPPLMGNLDMGQHISDEDMANLYNCMDVFVLPTGGEGFGIPTVEAMSCGVPICVTNYTTGYELIKCDDPENEKVPMYPLGGKWDDVTPNGRDHLEEEDICERGILLPYKDMWWDTPKRAAPQRALCSEQAICEALEYYYDNPKKRVAAGKAARAHALKEYSWDVIGKRWVEFFNDITSKIKPVRKKK